VGTVLGQMSLVRIFNGLSNEPKRIAFRDNNKKLTCAALLLLQDVGTQSSPGASAVIIELIQASSFRVVPINYTMNHWHVRCTVM
jgi:hypothetical protein